MLAVRILKLLQSESLLVEVVSEVEGLLLLFVQVQLLDKSVAAAAPN